MTFYFDTSLIEKYHNNSQKARVLTEDWVKRNLYCPICGRVEIESMKTTTRQEIFIVLNVIQILN